MTIVDEQSRPSGQTDRYAIFCRELVKVYNQAPAMPAGRSRYGPPAGGNARPPAAFRPNEAMGPVRAVDRLNLEVEAGEFFGLLGPNGAGKTTTIGMLPTRVIPTSGTATVAGIDVVADPALARTRLSAVTQTNTLDRSLDVFDNLYFHGRYFGLTRNESRHRAFELLEYFRLADKAREPVDALSGGLAQRLQIARALLHRPEVLFMDEPTSGLDPQARLALWETLRELHESGQTILLTTHYMEEADQLCQRVAIMDHGKLLALDAPRRLKDQVAAERVLTVTLAQPAEISLRLALDALPQVSSVEGESRTLHIYAATADGVVGQVVNAIADAGAELTDLTVAEPTLEAVYLKLTGREYRE